MLSSLLGIGAPNAEFRSLSPSFESQGEHRNIRHEHHCCCLRVALWVFPNIGVSSGVPRMKVCQPMKENLVFAHACLHVCCRVCWGYKVSMAHAGERIELERAFSGATVHDMFNM